MNEDREIVTLGTVNGWAFKLAIWFAPFFSIWMVTKVLAHDTDIAVLKMQITMRGDSGKVSQSVNVGQAKDAAGELVKDSAKTWLTTKDVAAREGVTERTVINYIESKMIEPPPRKNGKSWEIAEHFRIVPNEAEECRNIPPAEEEATH
jgi:hypothetical protein